MNNTRRISPLDNWIMDANGNLMGVQNPNANGDDLLPVTYTTDPLTGGISIYGMVVVPGLVINDASAASANTALIQAALNSGGTVKIDTQGVVWVSSTLLIGDNTFLEVSPKTEIKATSAVAGSLVTSTAFAASSAAVTVTWSAGMTASVQWTGHGLTVNDYAWLNRADQGFFNGVFGVDSVTDANNFVVKLRRLPTTAATGSVVAKKANKNISLKGGIWNFNSSGGNTGTGVGTSAIVLAGINNLNAEAITGADTQKYLLNIGAVSNYRVSRVGGDVLNSDCVKVYGPAFAGVVSNLFASSCGDDLFSAQTREPSAYVVQDYCQGDIIGLTLEGVGGTTTTSAAVLYGSPFGVIDGVTFKNIEAMTGGTAVRLETLYSTGTTEFGTVKIDALSVTGKNHGISLGSSSNAMTIKKLIVENPVMRSAAITGRLINIGGTAVTADIKINGGYLNDVDAVVTNSSTAVVTLHVDGLRLNAHWQGFRQAAASGTLNLTISNMTLEASSQLAFLSNNAGTPAINFRTYNIKTPADPVITLTGTPTFSIYGDMRVDVGATGFNKTTVGQTCINTGTRGTLVAGQPVICNGANWLQQTALGNTF